LPEFLAEATLELADASLQSLDRLSLGQVRRGQPIDGLGLYGDERGQLLVGRSLRPITGHLQSPAVFKGKSRAPRRTLNALVTRAFENFLTRAVQRC